MSLIGSLEEIKLADVLRLFAQGKKTGRLTVTAEEDQTTVRFQRGVVVQAHASNGRFDGDDAVLDLFGWKSGQLTFIPEDKTVTPNVRRSVDQLILEGLRVGDSLHRMHELIPSERAVFQMGPVAAAEDKKLTLGVQEWRLLRWLDGSRDVRELAEASKQPKGEVMRMLFELAEAGFLERVEPQKSLRAQPQGLFGRDSAEMDVRIEDEWRKLARFGRGVLRVEVRSGNGRSTTLGATFKSGLMHDVHLPRNVLTELGLREGEDVQVKPVA
jgi:hypothetical protein